MLSPQDQTDIRLRLLANGYTPLANHDKRCLLKGWSSMVVDKAVIEGWSDARAYAATGIRLVPGLCAIDVDIDDAEVVEALWEMLFADIDAQPLVRFGKGAKELWLCRVEPSFGTMFSTAHVRPGEDPEDDGATAWKVEAFGGDHGRQIGAYGAHTVGEIEYAWDGAGPVDVPFDDLPLLSKEYVEAAVRSAGELLTELGWPRVRKFKAGEVEIGTVHDLTDDMRFDCNDGVTRSLEEMEAFAKAGRGPRCSASWLEGPSARNRTRCIVTLDHEGRVCIHETAAHQNHLPAGTAAPEPREMLSALAEKLERSGYDLTEHVPEDAPDSFLERVEDLLDTYAYCAARTRPCLPIWQDEELSTSVANLKAKYASDSYEIEGPRGGKKMVSPVDVWVKHPERRTVDGYRYIPHLPRGVVPYEDTYVINSYRPAAELLTPVDPAIQMRHRATWEAFLKHLLPDTGERRWFCDWLAYKYRHPEKPGAAVLMVAPTHGVGRGTLFEMLEGVFGEDHVRPVSCRSLIGEGTQGQYTAWMANCLLVTVDEVLPDGETGTNMAWKRRQAYERIKERIDPRARKAEIVRKGLPNYTDYVYASYILATNHDNALPIPEEDRRFAVLTNGETMLERSGRLFDELNERRDPHMDPGFVACVRDWLREHPVSEAFDPHRAPHFAGRAAMIEANLTSLEEILEDVLGNMPHEWTTRRAYEKRVERELVRQDLKSEMHNWRNAANDYLRRHWVRCGTMNVDARGRKASVFARTKAERLRLQELPLALRAEELVEVESTAAEVSAETRAARAGLKVVKDRLTRGT